LVPVLALVVGAVVIALVSAGVKDSGRLGAVLAGLAVLAAAASCFMSWGQRLTAFGMVSLDGFSLYLSATILVGAALTISVAHAALSRESLDRGEFYALLLLSTAGALLMVATRHLVLLFIALETMSVGVYALSGWARGRADSLEAALKYFLYGAFASGFLLYGIALFYGLSGSGDLARIEASLASVSGSRGLLPVAALVLVLVGLAYKIAAVPFHLWAPDVYEGAPTSVTAFMAVAVKAAAFGALLRATASLAPLVVEWQAALSAVAVLTMTVGNLVAVAQDNVKRMLAYSGVAHAGYLLVGVVAGGEAGRTAVLYYLLSYTFMTFGAFAAAIAMGREGNENLSIRNWGGLGWKYPLTGFTMAIFMLALAGVPPTAGFFGKFALFNAAVKEGHIGLVLVAVANTVVSVYYYLRVIMLLYLGRPSPDPELPRLDWRLGAPLVLSAFLTVYLGLRPAGWLALARRAALELF